jgi:hypothetical protein
MATLRLELGISMNLSIVLSWLNTLADLYEAMNTYITETTIGQITELKILNSMEWVSIFQNIIHAPKTNLNGVNVLVSDAESLFNVLRLKLKDIQTRFVQESASLVHIDQKINTELWTLARKPLSEKTVASNVLKYGTGGINIDGCRVDLVSGIDDSQLRTMNRSVKSSDDGWGMNNNNSDTPQVVSPQGRFPANVITDGSDEVLNAFPDAKGQCGDLIGHDHNIKSPNDIFGIMPPRYDAIKRVDDSKSASRFFKQCKFDNIINYCYLCAKDINNESWKNTSVSNAEKNLITIQVTEESTAPKNVTQIQNEQYVHFVKCVANLCDLCAMSIVQEVVKIKTWDFKTGESQVIQDFISNSNKCTLLQNLAYYAEVMDNIDTTPTTQSLLKLFGSANHVIINYIREIEKSVPSRLIYAPKASKSERNKGLEGFKEQITSDGRGKSIDNPFLRAETVRINNHPTVKPIALMRYLCRLITPKNGTILDPYMGSGSTGIAAKLEGFQFTGIEREEEYCKIAQSRMDAWSEEEKVKPAVETITHKITRIQNEIKQKTDLIINFET